MALKPWYDVIKPREDLREGKPLDASEFAVHLDAVREGVAPADYSDPRRFFEKTVMTTNLRQMAVESLRRLSGVKVQANAVFNLATQFGGGKTHALTLLYHLAQGGAEAKKWRGVDDLLREAQVTEIPKAAVAIFVGERFDPMTGRGGEDGTPVRKTIWGEIAWQLGGKEAFAIVAEHDRQGIAPGGDVIAKMLPSDRPTLILMDEVINFIAKLRVLKKSDQFHAFLHSLSEEARNRDRLVLCVSVPKSVGEMTAEDHQDYTAITKLLERVGKSIVMSSDAEISEIIRRRLFDWEPGGLSREAENTIAEYAEWVTEKRNMIPSTFPVDHAREAFRNTYPFHPTVLSVFERKWQELPKFQRTRGVLRMLALWVSKAYMDGYKGAHKDPLIGLGTAPLDDANFRTVVFEQLGESRLEGAVTTDICGKKDSFALRLDQEASPDIRKARLHRKAMTAIFFESNGGQSKLEATEPEIRLAIGEPEWDIGHIDTVLEALNQSCYYLNSERRRFRFSLSPNLNKLLADRRAGVTDQKIDERIRAEVKKAFTKSQGLDIALFPEKSSDVTDRPSLTLAVLPPELTTEDVDTRKRVETMTKEYGRSSRTYKTAVIWVAASSRTKLREEARKLLAWEDIQCEEDTLRLDESQQRKLEESIRVAARTMTESVWHAYNHLLMLERDNSIKVIDLGQTHSSSAGSLPQLILDHLLKIDAVVKNVSPNMLTRRWPGFVEWSTKSVRDAFYASPLFPRLLNPESVKETIAKGVNEGMLAYVGRKKEGRYELFIFNDPKNSAVERRIVTTADIDMGDDVFIITAEEAAKQIEPQKLASVTLFPETISMQPGARTQFVARGHDQHGKSMALTGVTWTTEGGTVDAGGNFVAGEAEGAFSVRVQSGECSSTAQVIVAKKPSGATSDGSSTGTPGSPTTPDGKTATAQLSLVEWTGQVPSAKWMTFYTKVLSKYAKEKGLVLKASFELRPEGGLSKQQVDELRAILRELGLEDDVQAK